MSRPLHGMLYAVRWRKMVLGREMLLGFATLPGEASPSESTQSGERPKKSGRSKQWVKCGTKLEDGTRFLRLLGGGATSQVYAARRPGAERSVVIKVLADTPGYKMDVRDCFAREVWAYRQVQSPHVPLLLRTLTLPTELGGSSCLELEFAGQSLKSKLRDRSLSLDAVVELARQMFLGLSHVHAAGVVHADIKPGNILLRGKDASHAMIVDFGISRRRGLTCSGPFSETLGWCGTPAYMPPEQILFSQADERSDIYSACVVLFAAVTGRRPFEGKDPSQVMHRVLRQDPPPLSTLRPNCPRALATLIRCGMEKDIEKRLPNATAALRLLDTV